MTEQDKHDYLIEREGIRIYDGNQDEAYAMRAAQLDLAKYIERGEDDRNR